MARPMEQAFVLIGDHGFCGAKAIIEEGIHATARDAETVDAWVRIADCFNRIAARQTVH